MGEYVRRPGAAATSGGRGDCIGAPATGGGGHVLGPATGVTSCFGRCMGRSLRIFSIPNERQWHVL
jgi:hypothetical protein